MDYRKANSVSNTVLIISMVLCAGTFFFEEPEIQMLLLLAGAVAIVAAIVIRILYWRCPHCKKMLPLGFRMEPERCPKCKEVIIDKTKK